jgi:2-acylglycerol O-acyltransferase 2
MYMQHPKKERIKLKERKGFVRIAVEEGLDGGIIPVSGAWLAPSSH